MKNNDNLYNKKLNKLGKVIDINPSTFIYTVRIIDSNETQEWEPENCINLSNTQTPAEKSEFERMAEEIGKTVTEKNKAYGNSFSDAKHFLKLLYPTGVPVESYGDMLCIVRIFDKLKRIATKKDAYGESPFKDLAGYAILGVLNDETEKNNG